MSEVAGWVEWPDSSVAGRWLGTWEVGAIVAFLSTSQRPPYRGTARQPACFGYTLCAIRGWPRPCVRKRGQAEYAALRVKRHRALLQTSPAPELLVVVFPPPASRSLCGP